MKSCRFLILYALITFFFTLKSSYAHHQKGKKARIIIPPKEPFLASNAFSFLEENSQTFLGKEATHYGKITKSQKKDQGTRVKADTIRMGIELELQTYQYIPPDLEHFIDHIRLFESTNLHKNDNSPYWYLEVDGSRQLEFVSHDFTLPDEDTTLSKCVLEMNFVMQHLLQLAGPNQKQKKEEEELWAFSIKPGEKIDGIGVFVHRLPNGVEIKDPIQINIMIKEKQNNGNPFPMVLPQATFQIPLSYMGLFVEYMARNTDCLRKAVDTAKKIVKVPIEENGSGLS